MNEGDAGPLLDILKGLEAANVVHNGDSTTILEREQDSHPSELTRKRLEFDELSSIYMAEKQSTRNQPHSGTMRLRIRLLSDLPKV